MRRKNGLKVFLYQYLSAGFSTVLSLGIRWLEGTCCHSVIQNKYRKLGTHIFLYCYIYIYIYITTLKGGTIKTRTKQKSECIVPKAEHIWFCFPI